MGLKHSFETWFLKEPVSRTFGGGMTVKLAAGERRVMALSHLLEQRCEGSILPSPTLPTWSLSTQSRRCDESNTRTPSAKWPRVLLTERLLPRVCHTLSWPWRASPGWRRRTENVVASVPLNSLWKFSFTTDLVRGVDVTLNGHLSFSLYPLTVLGNVWASRPPAAVTREVCGLF